MQRKPWKPCRDRSVVVSLEKEEAIVQHEGADAAKLVEAIVEEGYAASMEK